MALDRGHMDHHAALRKCDLATHQSMAKPAEAALTLRQFHWAHISLTRTLLTLCTGLCSEPLPLDLRLSRGARWDSPLLGRPAAKPCCCC